METELKTRVERLEKQVRELSAFVHASAGRDSWQATFGLSANDPGFDEMIRLGRDFRNKDGPDEDGNAGP